MAKDTYNSGMKYRLEVSFGISSMWLNGPKSRLKLLQQEVSMHLLDLAESNFVKVAVVVEQVVVVVCVQKTITPLALHFIVIA
jgi:hypothetical protein